MKSQDIGFKSKKNQKNNNFVIKELHKYIPLRKMNSKFNSGREIDIILGNEDDMFFWATCFLVLGLLLQLYYNGNVTFNSVFLGLVKGMLIGLFIRYHIQSIFYLNDSQSYWILFCIIPLFMIIGGIISFKIFRNCKMFEIRLTSFLIVILVEQMVASYNLERKQIAKILVLIIQLLCYEFTVFLFEAYILYISRYIICGIQLTFSIGGFSHLFPRINTANPLSCIWIFFTAAVLYPIIYYFIEHRKSIFTKIQKINKKSETYHKLHFDWKKIKVIAIEAKRRKNWIDHIQDNLEEIYRKTFPLKYQTLKTFAQKLRKQKNINLKKYFIYLKQNQKVIAGW